MGIGADSGLTGLLRHCEPKYLPIWPQGTQVHTNVYGGRTFGREKHEWTIDPPPGGEFTHVLLVCAGNDCIKKGTRPKQSLGWEVTSGMRKCFMDWRQRGVHVQILFVGDGEFWRDGFNDDSKTDEHVGYFDSAMNVMFQTAANAPGVQAYWWRSSSPYIDQLKDHLKPRDYHFKDSAAPLLIPHICYLLLQDVSSRPPVPADVLQAASSSREPAPEPAPLALAGRPPLPQEQPAPEPPSDPQSLRPAYHSWPAPAPALPATSAPASPPLPLPRDSRPAYAPAGPAGASSAPEPATSAPAGPPPPLERLSVRDHQLLVPLPPPRPPPTSQAPEPLYERQAVG